MKKQYTLQISRKEMKEYGEYFRSMRESTGLSLNKFAPLIGRACRTSIARWEKGISIPQKDIDEIVQRYREVVKNYRLHTN